jgi:menaquinone-dependent protoporphyrinogen IX oxidase
MKNVKEQKKGKGNVKKIILGVLLLALAVGIFNLYSTVSYSNKEHKMDEIVLGNGEKKALLIYEPSKHGLAEEVSMSVAKIMERKGYTVTVNTPSKELSYNWENYDVIAFGSPIFMSHASKVLKEYVQSKNVQNKNIFIYACGAMADNDNKELNEMSSWVSENNNIAKMKCKADEKETFNSFVEKTMEGWN